MSEELIDKLVKDIFFKLKCAKICRVERVNEKTIDCRPVVSITYEDKIFPAPLLTDVPIFNMQGGSSYEAFPIAIGDYVLVIFADENIDNWELGVDNLPQREFRFHDINDGFAIGGFNNRTNRKVIPQHIYREGKSEHKGDHLHTGDYTQEGNYNHTGDTIEKGNTQKEGNTTQIGNLSITGTFTITGRSGQTTTINATNCTLNITNGDVIVNGVSFLNHTHIDSEGGTTSAPIGA